MKFNQVQIICFSILALLLFIGCGLPVTFTTRSGQEASTVEVEMLGTRIAANIFTGLTLTATQQSVPQPTATATVSPTASQVIIASTPVPPGPFVNVSGNTNCRRGPGRNFANIITLLTSQQAEVVAKNSALKYWVIRIPGSTEICWLWGGYATLVGDSTAIPEATSPPTPTALPTHTPSVVPTATPWPFGSLTGICTTLGHDPIYDADCTIWCPLYCPIRPDPARHCYIGLLDHCQVP